MRSTAPATRPRPHDVAPLHRQRLVVAFGKRKNANNLSSPQRDLLLHQLPIPLEVVDRFCHAI